MAKMLWCCDTQSLERSTMPYLSLAVALGALACLFGYQRLPRPIYRLTLVTTAIAATTKFTEMLGPIGWIIGPMAVLGVVTLMAMREELAHGGPCGLSELVGSARRLWRAEG